MPPHEPTSRITLVDVVGRDPVMVTLERDDQRVVGEGAAGKGGEAEAAARATLEAVDALTPPAVTFALDWCGVVESAPDLPPLLVVVVALDVTGVPMRYAGAVIIDADPLASAAAEAVLDALNRRLEIMQG